MNFIKYISNNFCYNDETGKLFPDKIAELVRELEDNVNCFGFNPKKLVEEYMNDPKHDSYGINQLKILAYNWINYFGSQDIYYDERNKLSVELCKYIYSLPEFETIKNLYFDNLDYQKINRFENVLDQFYKEFMRLAYERMHRTNMQTATKLFLYSFTINSSSKDEVIVKKLKEMRGEEFWRLPLI